MSQADAIILRTSLVEWYRHNHRDLPWRREVSAYRTLVSELMLQQTRVDTVIPYFERFMARWPSLASFAAATEEEVLEAWQGLGYYRRARNLLKACRAAHELGGLPSTAEALIELPGIGPYTAGAIASIAFGEPVPAVDGNVERVLSRVDANDLDPKRAVGRRHFAARAGEITAPGVSSEVTQGLMELGATVCTPKAPRCEVCPWQAPCRARQEGDPLRYPTKRKKKPPTEESLIAVIARRGPHAFWARRPEEGLLAGLWEVPMVKVEGPPSLAAAAEQFVAQWASGVGEVVHLGTVVHVFSHRRWTIQVVEVQVDAASCPQSYTSSAWAEGHPDGVGVSTMAAKVWAAGRQPALVPLAADSDISFRSSRAAPV